MPEYVVLWLVARWIGVPVWELEDVDTAYIEQARIVRHAEFAAQEAQHKRAERKRK